VKLHKLLYYSDFAAYRRLGTSISGVQYYNNVNGPMAAGFDVAIRGMERNRSLDVEMVQRHPAYQEAHVIRPRRQAKVEVFSPEELTIMDDVIEKYHQLNGTQISDLVHEEPGWRLTERGEIIPYETAWLAPTKLTPAKRRIARELAAKNAVLG
jgi:hypothetical protein